jgi:hypothetical protein
MNPTMLAAAFIAATFFAGCAHTSGPPAKEMTALRERVTQLERQMEDVSPAEAQQPTERPAPPQAKEPTAKAAPDEKTARAAMPGAAAAAQQQAAEPADAPAPPPSNGLNKLEKEFRKATVLLYTQLEDGSLRMMCTATAFEKKGKLYRFATAAHCVADDDTTHERVEVSQASWYITFDEPENKSFTAVKIVGVGYQHRGDDFAVVEGELKDESLTVIPLAVNDPSLGENISNFASPGGYGKQLFRGHVSMERLDRPLIVESINWKGASLLQTTAGPGSSGSAVVSQHQKAIAAFLVGMIGNRGGQPNIVAIPISKFRKFWDEVQTGKYKWHKKGAESTGAASSRGVSIDKLNQNIKIRWSGELKLAEPLTEK